MTKEQKLLHYYRMDVINAKQHVFQIKADLEAERGYQEEFRFRNMVADYSVATRRINELIVKLNIAIEQQAEAEIQLKELENLLEQSD